MAESCDITNTFNLTDELMPHVIYGLGEKVFFTILTPIVFIIGTFNNFAFLFVICRVKAMQNVINFYLANLAIGDLLYLITTAVGYMWRYFASSSIRSYENAPWKSPLGCQLPMIVGYASYFASAFMVTLVSIEKYFAICHGLRPRAMRRELLHWCQRSAIGA